MIPYEQADITYPKALATQLVVDAHPLLRRPHQLPRLRLRLRPHQPQVPQ